MLPSLHAASARAWLVPAASRLHAWRRSRAIEFEAAQAHERPGYGLSIAQARNPRHNGGRMS
jgi:hypothetical protein